MAPFFSLFYSTMYISNYICEHCVYLYLKVLNTNTLLTEIRSTLVKKREKNSLTLVHSHQYEGMLTAQIPLTLSCSLNWLFL